MFYAATFGAILAFVVMYTDSIYPAMIMHFAMNGLSVLGDYYPDSIYIQATYFYESSAVLLVLFGLISLAAVILLIRLLKKSDSAGYNQLLAETSKETEQAALQSDIAYAEWPLIFGAAIAIMYSVIG